MREITYRAERGRLDVSTARLLDELCATDDGARAYDLALALEARVGPCQRWPGGGTDDDEAERRITYS